MSLVKTTTLIGLISGLALPPIFTKTVLFPFLIQSKYDEIDTIKHNLDYIGWNVRNMEEQQGYKGDEVYVPVSYFQGHY